jgi:hypothetical protein
MENISFWDWKFGFEIVSLVRLASSFALSRYIVSSYQIHGLESLEEELCGKQGTIGRNLTTSRHLVVSFFHIL